MSVGRQFREMRQQGRIHAWILLLSFVMAVFQLVGRMYDHTPYINMLWADGNALKSLVKLIGYTLAFFIFLHGALLILQSKKVQSYLFTSEKDGSIRKEWLIFSAVLLIGWLPYLIAAYPGHMMGDTRGQLCQFFGIDNKLSNGVIRMDLNVLITNHHPVLHTVLLGGLVKLGRDVFGSDNIGLFIYTSFQYIVFCVGLGYSAAWLKKLGVSRLVQWLTVFFFWSFPIFRETAVLATKDALFSIFFVLFGLRTVELLLAKEEKLGRRWMISYIVIIALVLLFRNNGFYVVVLTLPFVLIVRKTTRKKALLALAAVLLIQFGWNSVALPAMHISKGSIAEMLALPFQQTARYMHEYEDEITEEEKAAISAVLDYERVKKVYTPAKADPVKFAFVKTSSKEDLKNYFSNWLKMGLKHPGCYIQATMCSLNGYYSYGKAVSWGYGFASAVKRVGFVNKKGFNFSVPASLEKLRNFFSAINNHQLRKYPTYPFTSAAIYDWGLIVAFVWMLVRKRFKAALVTLPCLFLLLTNLAGPVNARTYFRYEIPIAIMMPAIMMIWVYVRRGDEAAKEEIRL